VLHSLAGVPSASRDILAVNSVTIRKEWRAYPRKGRWGTLEYDSKSRTNDFRILCNTTGDAWNQAVKTRNEWGKLPREGK
jgi:hypothetical protein